jgi:uncharacterized membrane protein HdeD (DUF308 family)
MGIRRRMLLSLVLGVWFLVAGVGAAVWGEDAPGFFRAFLGFTMVVLFVGGLLFGGGISAVTGALSSRRGRNWAGYYLAGFFGGLLGARLAEELTEDED